LFEGQSRAARACSVIFTGGDGITRARAASEPATAIRSGEVL
jgi:hypothetical protein